MVLQKELFISRSAFLTEDQEAQERMKFRVIESKSVPRSRYIFVLGQISQPFVELGHSLGFSVQEANGNLARLYRSRHLVVYQIPNTWMFTKRPIMNFCLSYGIPMTWFHSFVEPLSWMDQFENILVGNFSAQDIWKLICRVK